MPTPLSPLRSYTSPSSSTTPLRPFSRPDASTPSSVATPTRLSAAAPRDTSPILDRSPFSTNQRDSPTSLASLSANRRASPIRRSSPTSPSAGPERWSVEREIRIMLGDVLKIELPDKEEETLGLLTDGVILCNFLNHLKPRSVPLIHVSSPQVRFWYVSYDLCNFCPYQVRPRNQGTQPPLRVGPSARTTQASKTRLAIWLMMHRTVNLSFRWWRKEVHYFSTSASTPSSFDCLFIFTFLHVFLRFSLPSSPSTKVS